MCFNPLKLLSCARSCIYIMHDLSENHSFLWKTNRSPALRFVRRGPSSPLLLSVFSARPPGRAPAAVGRSPSLPTFCDISPSDSRRTTFARRTMAAAASAMEKSERAEERGSVADRQTLPTSPGKVFDVDDEFSHFRRRNADAPPSPFPPLSLGPLFPLLPRDCSVPIRISPFLPTNFGFMWRVSQGWGLSLLSADSIRARCPRHLVPSPLHPLSPSAPFCAIYRLLSDSCAAAAPQPTATASTAVSPSGRGRLWSRCIGVGWYGCGDRGAE